MSLYKAERRSQRSGSVSNAHRRSSAFHLSILARAAAMAAWLGSRAPSGEVWVISIFLLAHAACNSLGAGRSEVPHTETMASPWVARVPANPMAQPLSGE